MRLAAFRRLRGFRRLTLRWSPDPKFAANLSERRADAAIGELGAREIRTNVRNQFLGSNGLATLYPLPHFTDQHKSASVSLQLEIPLFVCPCNSCGSPHPSPIP